MTIKTGACANCGKVLPISHLDGKPARFAGKPFTWDECLDAANRGDDFDVLECRACYGPAFEVIAEVSRG